MENRQMLCSMRCPMEQTTIAIIWDFDKTLIDGYMQDPIFRHFGVDSAKFWKEVNALPQKYAEQGVRVNKDTIYLNHFITCVHQGIFPGLSNNALLEFGAELVFYPGVREIFRSLKLIIANNSKYSKHGIHVEHYIVSTGLTNMIRGSAVAPMVDGIWGCEFIEDPIPSDLSTNPMPVDKTGVKQVGYIIDNTSKTRALFEINKGANHYDYVDVNSKMDYDKRRVPFENMIYIADGPSDVPVFSVLKQYGGQSFAVYPKNDRAAFTQVDTLRKEGRVDMYAIADYSEGTQAYLWLTTKAEDIADKIARRIEDEVRRSASAPPEHLPTGRS